MGPTSPTTVGFFDASLERYFKFTGLYSRMVRSDRTAGERKIKIGRRSLEEGADVKHVKDGDGVYCLTRSIN